MNNLDDILKSLDLPESSRQIYAELLENGETDARTLSKRLSITRPSVYDHVEILKAKGLIVEKEIGHKAFFAVDDVKQVDRLLKSSIEKLEEQKTAFDDLLPNLLEQAKATTPTIKFYEGKEGLTYLLNDVLWSGAKKIQTMWPHKEMMRVLDAADLSRFNKRRLQEGISIETLWPANSRPGKDYIWTGQDDLTERRYAPTGFKWKMGYSIYGDKVSFISSEKEVFGFIVNSHDFANLMRLQFATLWNLSRKRHH